MQRQYRDYFSEFKEWKPKSHARKWLIFPENIGKRLSIDEVALSQGELYTIVTNKKAKGRAGSIVAISEGTKADEVVNRINKISESKRRKVEEITLDMASSMKLIAKKCFPRATQVIDRFHVQKLALEALQEIRIKHRWEAIDEENDAINQAKSKDQKYNSIYFSNGDSPKQLLARSRYLLYKTCEKWTTNQKDRAEILFKEYPDIKMAYDLNEGLRRIYNMDKGKGVAIAKLAQWYDLVEKSGFKSFATIKKTIAINYDSILNYFEGRSTNAAAESFNAKVKSFRAQFRGVKNIEFFLFRLTNIYA